MSRGSSINRSGKSGAPDTVLLEKIRWSFRQRFRKQAQLLLGEFFDEVDDYFFNTGQKGELCSESVCLNAMRELRAKQSCFEERFLDTAITSINQSYNADIIGLGDVGADNDLAANAQSGSGMGDVEVDLALHAAQRKSGKHHAAIIQRIKNLQSGSGNTPAIQLIDPEVILQSVDVAFGKAHRLLSLPLELRLLFIKLFERLVMLRLDRIFQDVISIIYNANDSTFVDKLYSSSSAFQRASEKSDTGDEKTVLYSRKDHGEHQTAQLRSTANVRQAVDDLLAAVCGEREMPDFLEQVIKAQWREIIFLIGMHHGTTSLEWSEARYAMSLLVTVADQGLSLEKHDYERIIEQLHEGFSLIRWQPTKQAAFFERFAEFYRSRAAANSQGRSGSRMRNKLVESSLSPSGEQLLDREDLDEIARLLGARPDQADTQLVDYLAEVDALQEQSTVDFMLAGSYVQCLLSRKADSDQQFLISQRGARVSVTRSRLGVALALQSGEMRISQHGMDQESDSRTVMITAGKYRH